MTLKHSTRPSFAPAMASPGAATSPAVAMSSASPARASRTFCCLSSRSTAASPPWGEPMRGGAAACLSPLYFPGNFGADCEKVQSVREFSLCRWRKCGMLTKRGRRIGEAVIGEALVCSTRSPSRSPCWMGRGTSPGRGTPSGCCPYMTEKRCGAG